MEKKSIYKVRVSDPKAVVLFQKSIVHDLYETKIELPDGEIAKSFGNDATLLLDQKRLNGLGADTIKAYLNSFTPYNDSLAELRKKVSDTDLISCVKSRYIQSPSELSAWIGSLNETAQSIYEEIQSKKAEESTPAESSQPVESSKLNNYGYSSRNCKCCCKWRWCAW